MTDDKQEMVTIEVPVTWAENVRSKGADAYCMNDKAIVEANVSKALDARKSKYERWRDSRELPWTCASPGVLNDSTGSRIATGDASDAKLLAAAPELLEALIPLTVRHLCFVDYQKAARIAAKAIRAALPEDVADEVLGS